MKVRVSYIWDSEDNSYHPDNGSVKFDATVTPSSDDRMAWSYKSFVGKGERGIMPLTRGFEILPYLAGLARDVATILGGK